ncbi:MAG: hypothetical protein IKC52_01470 [Clostridia bacterium]|nr:hypothetical protein [Clostridia bacterium]MBR2966128.1 hypothetical protein [Clostridia bacterium]
MLLALKRYALPLALSACLYTTAYFVCGAKTGFFNVGFAVAILQAYSLRFADDLADYQQDVENGKALVSKPLLWCLLGISIGASIVLALVFQLFCMIAPTLLVVAILFAKRTLQKCLKMLFAPSVVLTLAQSLFSVNWILCAFAVVITAVNGILLFKGESK